MGVTIADAESAEALDEVRRLCWEYRDHLLGHDPEKRQMIEDFYPEDSYGALLASLPAGHDDVLLACLDGAPVGCAMSHSLDDGSCEVKRVFVRDAARGAGVARSLMTELVTRAAARGAPRVLLDTSRSLGPAGRLYAALGFVPRGAYLPDHAGVEEHLLFFEMPLP